MKIIFDHGVFYFIFRVMDLLDTAMVLAAGYGTRMRELSRQMPKPLLPVTHDLRLIDIILKKLSHQGFSKVVINVHYQSKQIMDYVGNGKRFGLEVVFSEEKELLGTGGGIAFAEKHFQGKPVLTANVDVLSTIQFRELWRVFQSQQTLATMAVKPVRPPQPYRLVLYDSSHRLMGFLPPGETSPSGLLTGIFTGYAILTAEARRYLKPQPQSVIEAFYIPALHEGRAIGVYPFDGIWMDVGTQEFYLAFKQGLQSGKMQIEPFWQ